MTTAQTFQGLNTDSKPSSRVLNPPGGSSSNIFGFDDQPKKHDSAKSNLENVTKGTNDALSHGPSAATAGSQQKPLVPKSGDDSFHTPFGIYQSSGYDKAPSNNGVVSPMAGFQIPKLDTFGRNYPRSKYSDADTFLNIFGEGVVHQRKMFRRIHSISDDSFSRVFGQKSLLDAKEGALIAAAVAAGKLENGDVKSGLTVEVPINTSHSNSCTVGSRNDKMKDDAAAFPVDPVFFRNTAFGKVPALSRRLSPRSAFNPITGEPYEQSKPKQEAPLPAVIPSESKTLMVESNSVLESTAAVNIAEPEKTQPSVASAPVPETTPATQQKQTQNVPFAIGTTEDVKEHRSTRVTQPPGGRSTKLW